MDRYVLKRAAGGQRGREPPGPRAEAGDGACPGKRPRLEAAGAEPPPPAWREIRAEGLRCDYGVLFGAAEADEIFQRLEEEVEYFEDIKMVGTT